MNEEIHKICMYCSTIYEGNIETYDPMKVSHGVCQQQQCRIEHIRYAFQCDTKGAKQILEETGGLEKKVE